jgi:transposase
MLRREREAGGRRQIGRKEARQVEVFVAAETAPTGEAGRPKLPGSRSLAWLLLADEAAVSESNQQMLEHLKKHSELTTGCSLAQQFLALIRQRQAEALGAWLEACLASGLRELVTFAVGLQREVVNVRAAVELPSSNGVAEGNVTRLKQIRRAMYGRGNFDLLRIRVLVAA